MTMLRPSLSPPPVCCFHDLCTSRSASFESLSMLQQNSHWKQLDVTGRCTGGKAQLELWKEPYIELGESISQVHLPIALELLLLQVKEL